MLLLDAHSRNLMLVSTDSRFDGYGVRRLW